MVATLEKGVPVIVDARNIIADFQGMIRRRSFEELAPWLERARRSNMTSFANGIIKDQAVVENAITSQRSNGQTEGKITKIRLVKRQMYGCGKLDLLQARVIGAV